MEAMLKLENLDILYPTKLPTGYEFTTLSVANFDTYLEVKLYSEEPYVDFRARIGENIQIDSYDNEINGIKYRISEHEGMYQADWSSGEDYYWVIVSDKAIMPEIIKNLQRSS
jgi:hypothetical protein